MMGVAGAVEIAINAIDFGNTLFITNDIARSHFPGPRICTEQHVNEWVALRDQCAADAEMKFWRCVNRVHPEGYEICQVLFFQLRFARTCSRSSPPPICSRPRRIVLPPARRSTPPSITRPTSSPRPRSTTAPATSAICWMDRQRRAGAAGRQHRHHLAAEAGRQRQVGRQPGAAGPVGYSSEVERLDRRHHRRNRRLTSGVQVRLPARSSTTPVTPALRSPRRLLAGRPLTLRTPDGRDHDLRQLHRQRQDHHVRDALAVTSSTAPASDHDRPDQRSRSATCSAPSTPSPAQARRLPSRRDQLPMSTGTSPDLVIGGTAGTLTALGLTAGTTARTGGTTALGGLDADDRRNRQRHRDQHHLRRRHRRYGQDPRTTSTPRWPPTTCRRRSSSAGAITITTTNDAASSTIGAIGGTAAAAGKAFQRP